jgi:hypothetical protein
MRAREPELRRERRAGGVERCLLRDRGQAERATHRDAPEGARRSPELTLDDLAVVHQRGS